MKKPTTIAKTKAIRMPGKKRPAASRLGIQGPPTPEPHPRNTGKNTKPSDSQPIGPTVEGSRLPIPSEPTPGHRPWTAPQGATPAEQNHNIKRHFESSILALQTHAAAG
jgi:hypothetical protein